MNDVNKITDKKILSEVKRRNSLFKKASLAEKRVLIAKDVLEQLRKGKFKPERSVFVDSYLFDEDNLDKNKDKSLQHALLEKNANCECCAQGALFLSCTLYNNKVQLSDFSYDDDGKYISSNIGRAIYHNFKITNGLNRIFTRRQLVLIEIAFERGAGFFNWDKSSQLKIPVTLVEKAIEFCNKYYIRENHRVSDGFQADKNQKDAMVAIMKNIIKNNGTFIP
jgi:hypothetical protein